MSKVKIETTIQTVTPRMCSDWLDLNKNNRNFKTTKIAQFARSMVQGDWEINGEALKFDTTGNVLDGQNRMKACLHANTSFKTFVITGLPRKVFDTLDTGVIRTPTDILAINKEKNITTLSSALRYVGAYGQGTMLNVTSFTLKETERLLENNPELRDCVAKTIKTRVKWLSGGITSACWHLAAQKHPEKADEFFTSLLKGTNLTDGSPILVIRNKFIEYQADPLKRLDGFKRVELIILAWNLWLKGKTVKHFRLTSLSKTSADFPQFN